MYQVIKTLQKVIQRSKTLKNYQNPTKSYSDKKGTDCYEKLTNPRKRALRTIGGIASSILSPLPRGLRENGIISEV